MMKHETSDELTLGEVAAFLGWTPRFLERLAVGGKMPGREIDGRWVFRRAELVDWLDQKIQTLDAANVGQLERHLGGEAGGAGEVDPLATSMTARLTSDAIELDFPATKADEIIPALVDLAWRAGQVLDPAWLRVAVQEREALCSTALPGGVAVLHPRRPVPEAINGPVLVLLRAATAVDFGAPDGEATRVFVLMAAKDERHHLHALARLTRVLRAGLVPRVLRAETPEAVIEAVSWAESGGDGGRAGVGGDAGVGL